MLQLSLFETAPPQAPAATRVIVSISGGKDSIASLLRAREIYGPDRLMAHHQIIPEDWPGTLDYIQQVCQRLSIPLHCSQAHYSGYECTQCNHRYLTSSETPMCRQCKSKEGRFLMQVQSLLDLVAWRKMWPSMSIRFCTSYLKRDVFNAWARANRSLFGEKPVLILGERWAESRGRSKLPFIRARSGMEWITEYRPILHLRRIDVFRLVRAHGIEPHYCYQAQGMTEQDMYETDTEGGARLSCVCCFLKDASQLQKSFQTPQGHAIMTQARDLEHQIGHTLKHGQSLAHILDHCS